MSESSPSLCRPSYRLLTPEQINAFHAATLELLETVGVRVRNGEARRMLLDAGCRLVGEDTVRIPGSLIEDAIRIAPSGFSVYDRTGREAMRLEGRRSHFGLGTDLVKTHDLETGEIRTSLLRDVKNAARIADALPEFDFIASYALPSDSPTNVMYVDSFKAQVENSVKPNFFTAAGKEDLALIHQMAAAVAGGEDNLREKPTLIHYSEPFTPLQHTDGAVAKLLYCADHGIPICYTPGMMGGASTPVTLAGSITVGNAEALSGLVIHQLRAPGAPIVSGFGATTMDLATSVCVYGGPEYRLTLAACADLFHHYGLPMWGTAGASDSCLPDQQAAMEWSLSLWNDAMSGANLIHDVAYLGQGRVGHPAALVMCAEIIGYIKRVQRGFDLDADHIALDEIRRVGPGGNFMASKHTKAHYRTEHWRPMLTNRQPVEIWQARGGRTWGQAAIEKAREILKSHQPTPLPADVQQSLDAIRTRALEELKDIRFAS